jgi:hypothetical protein
MKIHTPDLEVSSDVYKGSPHVFNAIENKRFALCGVITDNMDSPLYPMTCKHCIGISLGDLPNKHLIHANWL